MDRCIPVSKTALTGLAGAAQAGRVLCSGAPVMLVRCSVWCGAGGVWSVRSSQYSMLARCSAVCSAVWCKLHGEGLLCCSTNDGGIALIAARHTIKVCDRHSPLVASRSTRNPSALDGITSEDGSSQGTGCFFSMEMNEDVCISLSWCFSY